MSKHVFNLTSSALGSTVVATPAAQVTTAPAIGRLSLRLRKGLPAFDKALGIKLPRKIGTCTRTHGIEAVCLGPDEWLLLVELEQMKAVTQTLSALYESHPHSVTDITNREISFVLQGKHAAELLTIGCARDIATIEVGSARRVLFDVATIVLWRDGENNFRMDVWNSFASFVAQTLETGAKELWAEKQSA